MLIFGQGLRDVSMVRYAPSAANWPFLAGLILVLTHAAHFLRRRAHLALDKREVMPARLVGRRKPCRAAADRRLFFTGSCHLCRGRNP